ncbi:MAG TPA: hypothetical protein VHA09_04475 [Nitrososphaera sp.]|nr:hypothetical protein [Nitrososphaera sp.]
MSSMYKFAEKKAPVPSSSPSPYDTTGKAEAEGEKTAAPAGEMMTMTSMERLLEQNMGELCRAEGISRVEMLPIQRMFVTHYRCHACKLLPLYRLDLSHIKRPRCGRCGHLVSFTNAGKYGKMRKKLAVMLWRARRELDVR